MDVSASRLIVGCADRQIWVWDLRNLNAPSEKRQSSLKFQTRCVKLFPDDTGTRAIALWCPHESGPRRLAPLI